MERNTRDQLFLMMNIDGNSGVPVISGFPSRARPLRSAIISITLDNPQQVKSSLDELTVLPRAWPIEQPISCGRRNR